MCVHIHVHIHTCECVCASTLVFAAFFSISYSIWNMIATKATSIVATLIKLNHNWAPSQKSQKSPMRSIENLETST